MSEPVRGDPQVRAVHPLRPRGHLPSRQHLLALRQVRAEEAQLLGLYVRSTHLWSYLILELFGGIYGYLGHLIDYLGRFD